VKLNKALHNAFVTDRDGETIALEAKVIAKIPDDAWVPIPYRTAGRWSRPRPLRRGSQVGRRAQPHALGALRGQRGLVGPRRQLCNPAKADTRSG
jgi:hypothetical protein